MIFTFKKIQKNIKKNFELFSLILLLLATIVGTYSYNENKKVITNNYIDLINNIYFKKTLNNIFNNLAPKYLSIEHKISSGETFNQILREYEIPEKEIVKIKKGLFKNNNSYMLKVNQILKFTLDVSNNKKIIYFLFPVSKTEKIKLTRNIKSDTFERKRIITDLKKKIIFQEGKILNNLYKTAIDLNIEPNVIVEFARVYGFQIDFQRDIRKNDSFQIMYEVFEDNKGKIFETGNVIFADLKLRGQNNPLYYFFRKRKRRSL